LTQQPDSHILELIRADQSRNYGFNLLVMKYREKVYWMVRRMVILHDDADDVTQEVFIKVWKNISAYRGDAALFTWIYRIAANEALRFLQRKKTKALLLMQSFEGKLANELKAETYTDANAQTKILQQALLTLPAKQKLVFNMRYYDDLKYEDMSEILGTSVGALKASYHLAVKKIEEFVAKN
jgi:RNA polymerase sigma-70 factor (ECF subfamily)